MVPCWRLSASPSVYGDQHLEKSEELNVRRTVAKVERYEIHSETLKRRTE